MKNGNASKNYGEENLELFQEYIKLGFDNETERREYLKATKEEVLKKTGKLGENLTMEQYIGILREAKKHNGEIKMIGNQPGFVTFKDGTRDYFIEKNSHA